jgi:hypothetical protein
MRLFFRAGLKHNEGECKEIGFSAVCLEGLKRFALFPNEVYWSYSGSIKLLSLEKLKVFNAPFLTDMALG